MTRLFSLACLTASLLGAMAAPVIKSSGFSLVGTQHSGRGFLRESGNGACSDREYISGLPVVAVSAKLAGRKDACGLFAKVNRRDNPDRQYIFQVADVCEGCDKDSLGLTSRALHQFTNSDSLDIDWEFVSADDVEGQSNDDEEHSETTTSAKTTKTTTSSSKPTNKPSINDKDDSENDRPTSNSKTHRGRGTWFSDTHGSCGENFSQNDMIAALNEHDMGAQYGSGSKCGQKIRVSTKEYPGKSVVVRIVDTCPYRYCDTGAVDLSQAAFQEFAQLGKGVLDLEWHFI
ncbi:hypothetical protein BGZ59_000310 [Podila verticillata]|nr:hypothetical protein BGZ59_000310 [Podila verticillata]